MRFLISLAAPILLPVLGLEANGIGCEDLTNSQQGLSLLQHGSRKVASSINWKGEVNQLSLDRGVLLNPGNSPEWMESFESIDVNGRYCSICSMPHADRAPNNSYVQRSDCGNRSYWEHPENGNLPLSTFIKEATEEHNETNGWCELNFEKGCSDAVYNKDYLYFAKSVRWPNLPNIGYSMSSYDQHFCYYNGWLSAEIRALQHDSYSCLAEKGGWILVAIPVWPPIIITEIALQPLLPPPRKSTIPKPQTMCWFPSPFPVPKHD